MVTGLEAAGLALAILPLVIEAAKAYNKGGQSIKNVITTTPMEEKLQEFYDNFWWEMFIFDRSLRGVVNDLPLLCRDCKETLYSDRSLGVWEESYEVKQALLVYFGSQDSLDAFLLILSRLLELVDKLTRDKTTKLFGSEKDPRSVFKRLKRFTDDQAQNNAKSTFFERFQFFKGEKNRDVAIKNLITWNKRLKMLTESRTARLEHLAVSRPTSSFSEIRTLFNTLLRVVGNHWKCQCPSRHQAMICLRYWPSYVRDGKPMELEFEMLLLKTGNQQACKEWLEGSVLVQLRKEKETVERQILPKVCDVLREQSDSALHLLVTAADCPGTLWRMRPKPRRFSRLNNHPPTTLHTSLSTRTLTRLKEKRVLAVTFAYALLQCHASACMTEVLRKESIYFYHLTASGTDFETPFVMTDFEYSTHNAPATNMALQHRSPPVLQLGILFLEIHKGTLLKSLLSASEAANSSPNRDLEAVRRLVEDLEEWCSEQYKDAIRACLEIPWVPVGEKVDLGSPEFCGGFLEQVIKPLENELSHLFKLNI